MYIYGIRKLEMENKEYKGKTIYNPTGAAKEYSEWACNFYLGCTIGCSYCYNKTGRFKETFGNDEVTLKKTLKDYPTALKVFQKELLENVDSIRKQGLFFSFTTDPLLNETISMTICAIDRCQHEKVPVKVLTKTGLEIVKRLNRVAVNPMNNWDKKLVAYGVTLTGCDEEEPHASPNVERIEALKQAKMFGFKTFVSIEPILDFDKSFNMIESTLGYCDLFKVGLKSGDKPSVEKCKNLIDKIKELAKDSDAKFYIKESLSKYLDEADLCSDLFVVPEYNIFNGK